MQNSVQHLLRVTSIQTQLAYPIRSVPFLGIVTAGRLTNNVETHRGQRLNNVEANDGLVLGNKNSDSPAVGVVAHEAL